MRGHFAELIEVDFDVELTGFSTGEIDLLLDGKPAPVTADPVDDLTGFSLDGPAISQSGECWELGRHRLVCGDALQSTAYAVLLKGELAQMLVADPPFNVRINGHTMGRGKVRHREFKMASGEMSEEAFTAFLEGFIRQAVAFSNDGSIHYLFIDWRHLPELLSAARPLWRQRHNHPGGRACRPRRPGHRTGPALCRCRDPPVGADHRHPCQTRRAWSDVQRNRRKAGGNAGEFR